MGQCHLVSPVTGVRAVKQASHPGSSPRAEVVRGETSFACGSRVHSFHRHLLSTWDVPVSDPTGLKTMGVLPAESFGLNEACRQKKGGIFSQVGRVLSSGGLGSPFCGRGLFLIIVELKALEQQELWQATHWAGATCS